MHLRRIFRSGNSWVVAIPLDILRHHMHVVEGDLVWIRKIPNGVQITTPPDNQKGSLRATYPRGKI